MIDQSPDDSCFEPVKTGRYVILNIGRLGLLIPQHQVHALEPAFDVQPSKEEGAGWITVAGARSTVYCLSENLQPMREVPSERHICVLLEIGCGQFGVLCDQVIMFEPAELDIKPLPESMHAPDTPIQGLVVHGERVLCVCSADNLLACLGEEQEPFGEPPEQLLNEGVV